MKNTKENNITIGWIIYFIISTITVLVSSIIQKSNIGIIISSVFGIVYVLLIAKNKRIAFIFGIINVAIYGYILLIEKMYGGAIYNIVYSLPMLALGYIKWGKVKNEENFGIKIINKKNKIKIFFVVLILIIIYAIILRIIGGNNYILDSITTILGFLGIYLMSNKYIEQWPVWIISNLTNLLLWIIITLENINNIPMALMWAIYSINSIYGYVSWNKLYLEKNKIC